MKILTENLELIPHVELNPNDYRTGKTRSQHKIPRKEKLKYWSDSFAMAGIEGVHPLEKNWWHVPVREIHHERILLQLLKNIRHKFIELDSIPEKIIWKIEGGLSLFHEGKVIYRAQCCSDLTIANMWQDTTNYRKSDWILHWNGHPMIPVRYSEGMLRFAKNSDKIPTSKSAGIYAIPPDVLAKAVKQADKEVKAFQERLYVYWVAHQDDIWE